VLALTEVEVMLAAAKRALKEFEYGKEQPSEAIEDLQNQSELISEILHEFNMPMRDGLKDLKLIANIGKSLSSEISPSVKRHQLLALTYLKS